MRFKYQKYESVYVDLGRGIYSSGIIIDTGKDTSFNTFVYKVHLDNGTIEWIYEDSIESSSIHQKRTIRNLKLAQLGI